jgi:glycosyltransferase involved in cell wall biosynthesis
MDDDGHEARVASEAPLVIVAREAGGDADEGFRIFTREVAKRLRAQVPTFVYTAGGDPAPGMVRVGNPRPFLSPRLQREVRRLRPRGIIYIHRLTTAALLRSRYLKTLGRGCRVTLVDLQPSALQRHIPAWLWPDLLLVGSEADARYLRARGAPASHTPMATDQDRFRPPLSGEKDEIRRRWALPPDVDLVLHVGHMMESRNLRALIPLARRPGTAVVVAVSSHRDDGSDRLQIDLQAAGILIIEGYRPNIEELYRAADCYVFPVQSGEGAIAMPLSVLEALATDLPVVAAPYGALPEYFDGSGALCFWTAADDLTALVDTQLREQAKGRHLVEPWSWSAVVEALL